MKLEENIDLKKYNTYGVGGKADYFVKAEQKKDFAEAFQFADEKGIPRVVLGKGSNVIFPDEEYRGLVILNDLKGISRRNNEVEVSSGATLAELVRFSKEEGLGGAEFLAGIPGTVGGAIFGNAGAFGKAIGDIIESIDFLDKNSLKKIERDEMTFDYRDSGFKGMDGVIVSATLTLQSSTAELVEGAVRVILEKRKDKHPRGRTCGSFFKNIEISKLAEAVQDKVRSYENHGKIPAARLIEESGCKGMRVGGAEVSEIHANFIINKENASSRDILDLAEKVEKKVYDKFRVELEPEVRYL